MKKMRVTAEFRDRDNFAKTYRPGDVIDVDDERCARLELLCLAVKVTAKGGKAPRKEADRDTGPDTVNGDTASE